MTRKERIQMVETNLQALEIRYREGNVEESEYLTLRSDGRECIAEIRARPASMFTRNKSRVKTLLVKDKGNLSDFPNFHKSGSIEGMRKLYYGQNALLVRCGSYIYNVTSKPDIYEKAH